MTTSSSRYSLEPLGYIESPYKQKFGIPRQPGLVKGSNAKLNLVPPYNRAELVMGLEEVSHLWLTFIFHATEEEGWKPTVRPPRLGGKEKRGVLATRSTHRPNHLGLSVVELIRVDTSAGVCLHLEGVDLLDGTPVVDIKPYLPYVDAVPGARCDYAPTAPALCQVEWTDVAKTQAVEHSKRLDSDLISFITQVLQQDPRPAYQRNNPNPSYGTQLFDLNVKWRYLESGETDSKEALCFTGDTKVTIKVTGLFPVE